MKALQTNLAKQVLSDPKAREQLWKFFNAKHLGRVHTSEPITVKVEDERGEVKTLSVTPRFVPKAR
jgi:hypothetical protein